MNARDWLRFEGLDERWQERPAARIAELSRDPPEPAPPPVEGDPCAWCARLTELAAARWGAGTPLVRVLAELSRLVDERFAPASLHAADAAAELAARIAEWVTHVEDLAEVQR